MLRHYFVIAFRNLKRNLNYSLINIGGLAIGLASFLFIVTYINDELRYDRFHENASRIYRVNRFYNSNEVREDAATCSFPFGPALKVDYPEIVEEVCRFFNFQTPKYFFEYRKDSSHVVKFNERRFFLVDSTVFDIFTFPFIKGDPATALNRPHTIVLTESTAERYFGEEDPIGKVLLAEENFRYEVTGVIEDLPSQSHFKIDMMGSMSTYRQMLRGSTLPQSWVWNPCWTYVLLKDGFTPEIMLDNFPEFYQNHYPDLANQDVSISFQPLTDIHLKSHHDYEMHPNSNILYVQILIIIAGIVLVIACINFMNLTTANSASRAKEIGIKKVFGASRKTLIWQFIGETIVLSFIAFVIASVAVELLLPAFNNFTGKTIISSFIFNFEFLVFAVFLTLVVGVFSGAYPAFFLSSFKPIAVLQGTLRSGAKSGPIRKVLVVVQFSISIALIIGTLVVYSQLKFIRKTDLGFEKEQIILLPTVNQIAHNYSTFKQNLLKYPQIKYVTGMEDILGANHNTRRVEIEGLSSGQQFWYPMFLVRHDFIETFDIEVVEGRGFSSKISTDTANAIMINETMVKNLGWTNKEAIGKLIRSDADERVIGVFKDFHILSLHKPINNFLLDMVRNPIGANIMTRYVAIRVNNGNMKKILAIIEKEWNYLSPNRPFEYSFLNQDLNNLYKDEDKFGRFSVMLTILALFIACLGLFGLLAYLAERKTKEIGVRKAMGAKIIDIIKLLSKEFIWLIIFANIVAWPVASIVANDWLENFTKSITLNAWLFIISGAGTLLIAILITIYRAYRASVTNPATILRYE